jgi:hypothetical protein
MMIQIEKYSHLPSEIRTSLNELVQLEFGNIPIVQETQWAVPDWTVMYLEEGKLVSFYNIVERIALIDDKEYKVAGINNVITPAEYRGMGYSTKTLKISEYFLFEEIKSDLGILLCADDLVPFYQRLSWYKVDCPVYFQQPSGQKLWSANTMLLSKTDKLTPVKIDLNGLPW